MAIWLVAADTALGERLHVPFTDMRIMAGGAVHVHTLLKTFAAGKQLVLGAMYIQLFWFTRSHNIRVKIVAVGIARPEAEDGFLRRLQAGMAYGAQIELLLVFQGADIGDIMR